MVPGIDSFKEWFKGSKEQYAIIGGTACDILMTEEGLDFRATKDIDLVIERTAKTVANGINLALHRDMTLRDIESYL